jgi:hypothetical protein
MSFDEQETGFSRLPPEILDTIIDYLDYYTLRRCVFVSSAFYSEIRRRLCRRARLRLLPRLDAAGEPTIECKGEIVVRVPGEQATIKYSQHFIKEYVHCLDIEPHDLALCSQIKDGDGGAQERIRRITDAFIVRLNCVDDGGRARFHLGDELGAGSGVGTSEAAQSSAGNRCRAITSSQWYPRVLVFRNFPAYFRGLQGAIPDSVLRGAFEHVYLLGPLFLGVNGTPRDTLYLNTLPNTSLCDAVVVFTSLPGLPFSPMLKGHEPWDDATCAKWFDRLLHALAASYFALCDTDRIGHSGSTYHRQPRLTFVNAGAIEHKFLGTEAPPDDASTRDTQAAVERMFRTKLRALLPPNTFNLYNRIRTGEGIRFPTMSEFIVDNGRYLLDGDMVEAWDMTQQE